MAADMQTTEDTGFDQGVVLDEGTDSGARDDLETDSGIAADAGSRPDFCVAAAAGLQDITGTPAGAYFVHHPSAPDATTATVIFLPGGPGPRGAAQITWDNWLKDGAGLDDFRVVVPYAEDGNFPDESERALLIRTEVLTCYGGDPDSVHLAGTSAGGTAAFALMRNNAAEFATLLGAPGVFQGGLAASWAAPLQGKAVFNGVGELDDANWRGAVQASHDAMVAGGVESVFVEFAGQGHFLNPGFDESVFFEFWSAH